VQEPKHVHRAQRRATNFDTTGCPMLRRRAAAENDPVSTTSTTAAIAASRSMLPPAEMDYIGAASGAALAAA